MEFRECAWQDQLYFQRLLHGAGAEVTERSLPNYPGAALREVLRQSGHPHNIEPLLLTLRRPANAPMRKRFAEVAGELVLLEKLTRDDPVATDFKVAHLGQVTDAVDGILYPTQDSTTKYEVWLRAEMLDILRLMIEENLVRSLVPEMQVKLIADMLRLAAEPSQAQLLRLYAFAAAYSAAKQFHAARATAIKAGFGAAGASHLAWLLGEHAPDSVLAADPCERLKALTTAVEALYLVALSSPESGDLALPPPRPAPAKAAAPGGAVPLAGMQRSLHLAGLQADARVAPLLAAAVEQLWGLLKARDEFTYAPPPRPQPVSEAPPEGESPEKAELRAKAEEAVAASNLSFADNFQLFLKRVYATELVPAFGQTGLQLAAALLQLLAAACQGDTRPVLPAPPVLQQLAAYSPQPLLAATGGVLLAMAGAEAVAPAAAGLAVSADTAIAALPGHEALELAEFGRACFACGSREAGAKLLRCAQCGVVWYCSPACQKADWRLGHKDVCRELGESRAALAAAAATAAAAQAGA